MIDRPQELSLVRETPTLRVAELFEDVVSRDHLVTERSLVARRPMVGLELRVGTLDDFERGLVLEVVDQVRGEVVGRPKRRVQVRGRGERDATDVHERDLGREADDRVALVVESAATGASRHLRVLPTREELSTGVGVLGEALQRDGTRGHVDPERESLGGEHDREQVELEARLDDLAKGRHHARVVHGESPAQAVDEVGVLQGLQVVVTEVCEPRLRDEFDIAPLLGCREHQIRHVGTDAPRRHTPPERR